VHSLVGKLGLILVSLD